MVTDLKSMRFCWCGAVETKIFEARLRMPIAQSIQREYLSLLFAAYQTTIGRLTLNTKHYAFHFTFFPPPPQRLQLSQSFWGLRFVFSVVFLVSLLAACEKQEDILPAAAPDFTYVDSDGNLGYYFLDGRPVRYENFGDAFVMGQTVIVSKGKPTETGPSEIEVHSFTSLEDYFTFSEQNGGYARRYHQFDQELLALNDRYDIYRTFDETGNVPVEYTTSVDMLKTDLLKDVGAYNQLDFSKLIARLYRDCSPPGTPGGSFSPALSQMPFMTNLNNEVSMIGRFAVVTLNFLYDRSFYRDRFGEVTGTSILDGFNNVRFCPGERFFFINDRISSAMFT